VLPACHSLIFPFNPSNDVSSYAYGDCENDRPSRKYMLLIRQLGTTFIILLCVVVSLCYSITRFVGCELELVLSPTLWQTGFKAKIIDTQYQWDIIRPGEHCLRFATREYTSRLVQVRGLHDSTEAMRACHETPVKIHGRQLKSDWCQDLVRSYDPTLLSCINPLLRQGFGRGIYGFWIVDFEETDCETHWGKFNDLVCYDP